MLGENYSYKEEDYRQKSGYYSGRVQGQHQIEQEYQISGRSSGKPKFGYTGSRDTDRTTERTDWRLRGRGSYRGSCGRYTSTNR